MSTAARLLALALAVAALVAGGYRWGASATANRFQADSNRAAIKAQERFDAELLRGQAAVASLTTERQVFAASYTHLQEQFHELSKRIPLVTRRAVPVACRVDLAAGAVASPAEPQGAGAADVQRGVDVLSAGALWMWNSALAGTDQPAGACGAADTSEAACAPASAITLDDAWRNHETNARLCAEDRLNHQRLIDFINGQTTATTSSNSGQQARENQP
jgi:hypothetical protein